VPTLRTNEKLNEKLLDIYSEPSDIPPPLTIFECRLLELIRRGYNFEAGKTNADPFLRRMNEEGYVEIVEKVVFKKNVVGVPEPYRGLFYQLTEKGLKALETTYRILREKIHLGESNWKDLTK